MGGQDTRYQEVSKPSRSGAPTPQGSLGDPVSHLHPPPSLSSSSSLDRSHPPRLASAVFREFQINTWV